MMANEHTARLKQTVNTSKPNLSLPRCNKLEEAIYLHRLACKRDTFRERRNKRSIDADQLWQILPWSSFPLCRTPDATSMTCCMRTLWWSLLRFRLETAKTLPFWLIWPLNLGPSKTWQLWTICQKELELQAVISLSDKLSCLILCIPPQNDLFRFCVLVVGRHLAVRDTSRVGHRLWCRSSLQ